MRNRILIVEDDGNLAENVVTTLRRARFDPTWVADGAQALRLAPDEFALIILDLMLPGVHGLDVLKRIRERSDVPILVLSGRDETEDKVRALQMGADDFVTKPFWPGELLERVHARIRRPALVRGSELRVGPLLIDLGARSVRSSRRRIDLTKVEFDLLVALARRLGTAVDRRTLADSALGFDREGGERTLDVHMSRLRKKLGARGRAITTVRGVGYRLDARLPA
jgi:two-component system response regulator MtrA